MSAPTAEPARGAGAGTIVGIALALLLLAALVAVLIAFRGRAIDGAAQLRSAFGVSTVGPEYAIVEAREMAGGGRMVVLEDASAPAEPRRDDALDADKKAAEKDAAVQDGADKDSGGKNSPDKGSEDKNGAVKDDAGKKAGEGSGADMKAEEKVDWSRVSIPPSISRPRRIVFLFPAPGASHDLVADSFRNVDRKSLSDLGPQGGKVTIASGKLAWRGFDADWVHERAFEKGGTFRDAMRVDLSVDKQPCVMTAEWTRGDAAARKTLDPVLDALGAK
jgi:hypothetical protein